MLVLDLPRGPGLPESFDWKVGNLDLISSWTEGILRYLSCLHWRRGRVGLRYGAILWIGFG